MDEISNVKVVTLTLGHPVCSPKSNNHFMRKLCTGSGDEMSIDVLGCGGNMNGIYLHHIKGSR